MGVFDSVHWKCPHCEVMNEYQSKAGACMMKNYTVTSVPLEIAGEMALVTETCPEKCYSCGTEFRFHTERKRINLDIVPINKPPEGEPEDD